MKIRNNPTTSKKACQRCLVTKPAREFYRHGRMADGRLSFCKECTKNRVKEHREKNIDRIHEYDRKRSKNQDRKRCVLESQKRRRKKHPEKYKAHMKVQYAIRVGKLTPSPCETCGTTDRIQAHHDDYSKPLDVRWLCFKCHREKAHGQKVTTT